MDCGLEEQAAQEDCRRRRLASKRLSTAAEVKCLPGHPSLLVAREEGGWMHSRIGPRGEAVWWIVMLLRAFEYHPASARRTGVLPICGGRADFVKHLCREAMSTHVERQAGSVEETCEFHVLTAHPKTSMRVVTINSIVRGFIRQRVDEEPSSTCKISVTLHQRYGHLCMLLLMNEVGPTPSA